MFDLTGPFFRPLWRRILILAIILAWTGVEFFTGSPFWGMLFLGLSGWCVYQFFFVKIDE